MTEQACWLEEEVFTWLARLPFLAPEDLALLTGRPGRDIKAVLHGMDRNGWADRIMPSSPEMDSSPLYVLTEPARQWAAGSGREANGARMLEAPLAWNDIVHCLLRLEATVGLNIFAANFVSSARRDGEIETEDLCAVPALRPWDAWWPSGIQANGCLTRPGTFAPFFVLVDRAGVPAEHRRALVAGWYAFRDSSQAWGRDDIPPILVICAQPEQEQEWARAVLASADRRRVAPLCVLLTHRSSGFSDDPLGRVWRTPDRLGRAALKERLIWRRADSAHPAFIRPVGLPDLLEADDQVRRSLQQWARSLGNDDRRETSGRTTEQLAALSLSVNNEQKRLIECIGRLPLLAKAELAVVLALPVILAGRLIEQCLRQGLIAVATAPVATSPRYHLTETGLRLLAARDGVPWRRYARDAHLVAALPEEYGGRLQTLSRQFEHTTGANGFLVNCLTRRSVGGPRLVSWRSVFDAAIRFDSAGLQRWLRPDGAGDVEQEGAVHSFFLEWDRDTEKRSKLREKLDSYAAYYRAQGLRRDSAPVLLFVTTTTARREDVIWDAVAAISHHSDVLPGLVLTSLSSLVEWQGPFGTIWRSSGSRERRQWPRAAE